MTRIGIIVLVVGLLLSLHKAKAEPVKSWDPRSPNTAHSYEFHPYTDEWFAAVARETPEQFCAFYKDDKGRYKQKGDEERYKSCLEGRMPVLSG